MTRTMVNRPQGYCPVHYGYWFSGDRCPVCALGEDAGPDNQEACQPNLVVAPRLPDEGMPASSPSALAEGGNPREADRLTVLDPRGQAPPSASASDGPPAAGRAEPPLGGRARTLTDVAAESWLTVTNMYRRLHGLGPL